MLDALCIGITEKHYVNENSEFKVFILQRVFMNMTSKIGDKGRLNETIE